MKKRIKILSSIIAGLAFMFVFGVNFNIGMNENADNTITIESIKVQTASAEDGYNKWCVFNPAGGCCWYTGSADGIQCGLICTC